MTDKQMQEYCPFNVNKDYCHINDTGDYIIPFCKKEKCKFLKWYKSVEDRLWGLEVSDKQIIIDRVDVSGCKYFCKFTTICRNENIGRVVRPRCKNVVDCHYKQLKRKEQECEEMKRELQAQRAFTAHDQKLIYCVAYDETCKTGNDCKQEKCIFKDNIKLKQALADIKEIAEKSCCLQPTSTCEEYENCKECSRTSDDETVKQILQKISEFEAKDDKSNR